jgi:hypothetical protein
MKKTANLDNTQTNNRELLSHRAGAGERTQCSEERAIQIQHAERSIKPNCQPTSNSIEKMDSSKRTFEERTFPKEDNRLLFRQTGMICLWCSARERNRNKEFRLLRS